MFTTSYKPHHVPILYKNKEIVLPPAAEEVSNFWCSASTSAYGTKEKFIKNFWSALLSKLPNDHILKKENAEFHQVDFSKIKAVNELNDINFFIKLFQIIFISI
jgi:DNA topoisomerase IB